MNTKLTRFKYLPGARAYKYTSLVMKIIQKFVATMKAKRPIKLIEHKVMFVLSMYPIRSAAEYNISLMSRKVRTCMIWMLYSLHLKIKSKTRDIRKSVTPKEHHAFTFSTSMLIFSTIIILVVSCSIYIFIIKIYFNSEIFESQIIFIIHISSLKLYII